MDALTVLDEAGRLLLHQSFGENSYHVTLPSLAGGAQNWAAEASEGLKPISVIVHQLKRIAREFPESGCHVRWTRAFGDDYSFAVTNGLVFVLRWSTGAGEALDVADQLEVAWQVGRAFVETCLVRRGPGDEAPVEVDADAAVVFADFVADVLAHHYLERVASALTFRPPVARR